MGKGPMYDGYKRSKLEWVTLAGVGVAGYGLFSCLPRLLQYVVVVLVFVAYFYMFPLSSNRINCSAFGDYDLPVCVHSRAVLRRHPRPKRWAPVVVLRDMLNLSDEPAK